MDKDPQPLQGGGLQGLSDRSRRPYRQANQLPLQIETLIVRPSSIVDLPGNTKRFRISATPSTIRRSRSPLAGASASKSAKSTSASSLQVKHSESNRRMTGFGSSPSWIMIWATSTMRRADWNHSLTRLARGCLPMCPEQTHKKWRTRQDSNL